MSVATACNHTIDFLVKRGIVSGFVRSGPHKPKEVSSQPLLNKDQTLILHYATLVGDLYQDDGQWEFVYRLVKSFTRAGKVDAAWRFEDAFGALAVPLDEVSECLPSVFVRLGFETLDKAPNGRSFLFRSSESATVDRLPEPYGKWLQHRKHDAKWSKPIDLELRMDCRLSSPEKGTTHVTIEASTFAVSILSGLNEFLSKTLNIVPPLRTTKQSLHDRTTLKLLGRPVDLSPLLR